MFDPPEGQAPYSYVFDLTGEVHHDRPDMVGRSRNYSRRVVLRSFLDCLQVQISQTLNVARLIGQEAAKRKVKAYVRVQHPYYETPEKGTHTEEESIKPAGVRGVWWHETVRALAAIAE